MLHKTPRAAIFLSGTYPLDRKVAKASTSDERTLAQARAGTEQLPRSRSQAGAERPSLATEVAANWSITSGQ
jgi:hypothetical protein